MTVLTISTMNRRRAMARGPYSIIRLLLSDKVANR